MVKFSPHAWGWSVKGVSENVKLNVLPTRVGMVRGERLSLRPKRSSPHTRGDDPLEIGGHKRHTLA